MHSRGINDYYPPWKITGFVIRKNPMTLVFFFAMDFSFDIMTCTLAWQKVSTAGHIQNTYNMRRKLFKTDTHTQIKKRRDIYTKCCLQ